MTNVVMVVDVVVDTKALRLYLEDDTIVEIPHGDPRLTLIVEQVTPILLEGMIARVDLNPLPEPNSYKEYEDQSGGVVTFFKMVVSAVKDLFGYSDDHKPSTPAALISVTAVPFKHPATNWSAPEHQYNAAMQSAVREVIATAQPASTENFVNIKADENQKEETIMAVVNVEKAKNQFESNLSNGNTVAVDAFMRRMATVASERKHSADDLLKFLKKADLPIAEDGCIVIYKFLVRVYVKEGQYMDVHSRRVYQDINDYVCVDAKLIGHNGTVECSNGLHVGNRVYMGSFGGDVVVLAKVAPEDVIAVYQNTAAIFYGDSNKMRVSGYHILFELPAQAAVAIRANQDNEESRILLDRALSGDHPPKGREVRINAPNGYGVVYTPLGTTVRPPTLKMAPVEIVVWEPDAPTAHKTTPVDSKKIAEKVTVAKAVQKISNPKINTVETHAEKARRLYNVFLEASTAVTKISACDALWLFKRKTKLSFLALGLTYAEINTLPPSSVGPLPRG